MLKIADFLREPQGSIAFTSAEDAAYPQEHRAAAWEIERRYLPVDPTPEQTERARNPFECFRCGTAPRYSTAYAPPIHGS